MTPVGTFSVILTVGVVVMIALCLGRRFFPGTRLTVERLHCPFRDADVEVGFAEAVWDLRRLDVERCSAFAPPTAVTCDKRCLEVAGSMARW